jgi:hypothetical protein
LCDRNARELTSALIPPDATRHSIFSVRALRTSDASRLSASSLTRSNPREDSDHAERPQYPETSSHCRRCRFIITGANAGVRLPIKKRAVTAEAPHPQGERHGRCPRVALTRAGWSASARGRRALFQNPVTPRARKHKIPRSRARKKGVLRHADDAQGGRAPYQRPCPDYGDGRCALGRSPMRAVIGFIPNS